MFVFITWLYSTVYSQTEQPVYNNKTEDTNCCRNKGGWGDIWRNQSQPLFTQHGQAKTKQNILNFKYPHSGECPMSIYPLLL